MRVAVLDLGTNTFNLVVAEKNGEDTFQILCSKKLPVKLGEGGMIAGEIRESAFIRGVRAVMIHRNTIRNMGIDKVRAFGTSALRTAKNGLEFLAVVKEKTGIDIEIITGDREAELIYYGVRQTFEMTSRKYLLLDIGGGSNELIIANNRQIFWKKSYRLGIARLLEKFKPSDPITPDEIMKIESYLDKEMSDLIEYTKKEKIETLLGASGSFETFAAMIHASHNLQDTETGLLPVAVHLPNSDFDILYNKLIKSTIKERHQMNGLESMRIEMIVLACLFVKFVARKLRIKTIIQSNFSLKEGAVYQLLKNKVYVKNTGHR